MKMEPEPNDVEHDIELKAAQSSALDGVTQCLRDWLRLVVAHFDAVETLVNYVTGSHFHQETISTAFAQNQHSDTRISRQRYILRRFETPQLRPTFS